MGLDFIELIFQLLGRAIFWLASPLFHQETKLSEGTYEVIGFIFTIILVILALLIKGAINV